MRKKFLALLKIQKENGLKSFRLNHPAYIKDIEDTERRLGVKLPDDYREFLLTIGNGGDGPFNLSAVQKIDYLYDSNYICIGDGGCGFFYILDCSTKKGRVGHYDEEANIKPFSFGKWYENQLDYFIAENQKKLQEAAEVKAELENLPHNIADWHWNPHDTHRFYKYLYAAERSLEKYGHSVLLKLGELPQTYHSRISYVESCNQLKLFDLSLKALDKAMKDYAGESEQRVLFCLKAITLIEKGDVDAGFFLLEKLKKATIYQIEYKYQIPLALSALRNRKFEFCINLYKESSGELLSFIWQACINYSEADLCLEFIHFLEKKELKTKTSKKEGQKNSKLLQTKRFILAAQGDLKEIKKINENDRHQVLLTLFKSEKYTDALHVAETLKESKDPQWLNNIVGCCLMGLKRYKEALKAFEKSYALVRWPVPAGNIGHAYIMMEEWKKAKAWLEKCLYCNPYDEWAHYFMALYYLKKGETKKMKNHLILAKKYGFTKNNLKLSDSDDQKLILYWDDL